MAETDKNRLIDGLWGEVGIVIISCRDRVFLFYIYIVGCYSAIIVFDRFLDVCQRPRVAIHPWI